MAKVDKYSDENQLVKDLRDGDREAFRFLVEKYHVRVIRTCMGFVHNSADAEDIAQEVFIEIIRSAASFRSESGLSTWIYRIAVNKSLNHLKRASRRRIVSFLAGSPSGEELYEKSLNVSSGEHTDDNLIRRDQAKALEKALESLPESQRTAFVLSRYEELSYREISDVMGLSVGSVESLIFRARKGLQQRLYDFYMDNLK